MLLKLFKSNKALVLSLLPILGFFLIFPAFRLGNNTPYSSILVQLLSLAFILLTAFILNKSVNKSDLFNRPFFLSALCYVLMACAICSLSQLNILVISNLFLTLAIGKLFKIKRQVSCKGLVFDSSCLILISGLFYPPYFLFILLPWFSLSIIKTFNFKEWMMPLIAILVFGLYTFIFGKVFNSLELSSLYSELLFNSAKITFNYFFVFYFTLAAAGLISALYVLAKLNTSATNRFKKLSLVILTTLLLAAVILIFNFYFGQYILGVFSVVLPVSILLPFFLIHSKKQFLIEIILSSSYLLLLIAVLSS
tara:strand:+ start:574 stop:1500 length:927 start_codon:yes stop_codon:yes gene_type:complete